MLILYFKKRLGRRSTLINHTMDFWKANNNFCQVEQVLGCLSYHNKVLLIVWFQQQNCICLKCCSLTAQNEGVTRLFSLACFLGDCKCLPCPLWVFPWSFLSVSLHFNLFWDGHQSYCISTPPMTSFSLIYFFSDPGSKYRHILRALGIKTSYKVGGWHNSVHS